MNRVVVDASLALAWGFPDESSQFAADVLAALDRKTIFVPALWAVEVNNGLLVAERKKRLGPAQIKQFMSFLENLSIEYDTQPVGQYSRTLIPLAREHGLTCYDAAYLELALRHGTPLATLDAKLQRACKQSNVNLFPTPPRHHRL